MKGHPLRGHRGRADERDRLASVSFLTAWSRKTAMRRRYGGWTPVQEDGSSRASAKCRLGEEEYPAGLTRPKSILTRLHLHPIHPSLDPHHIPMLQRQLPLFARPLAQCRSAKFEGSVRAEKEEGHVRIGGYEYALWRQCRPAHTSNSTLSRSTRK